MNLEAFLLCDAATDSHGKLNVLGAFDRILLTALPGVHGNCAVAIRLRFERMEAGPHVFEVHFVDQDGKDIIEALSGNMQVRFGDGLSSAVINLILNLVRVRFDYAGEYQIDLRVDGETLGVLPVSVKQMAPGQTPPAG